MLGPLPCGLLSQAPLIPRLRGHFAEFLGNASPAGLGVLPLPACVGLRYGCRAGHSGFSWHAVSGLRYSISPHVAPSAHAAAPLRAAGLLRLCRSSLSRPRAPHASPRLLPRGSTGISTCHPSATRPRLALGPDLPGEDQLHPGNLGHPAWGIPTPISLLIPAFSLPGAPRTLTGALPRASDAPLPAAPPGAAPGLRRRVSAPDIFGAGALG